MNARVVSSLLALGLATLSSSAFALPGVDVGVGLVGLVGGSIIDKASAKGVDVLLAGMEAPPNLGEDYATAFRSVFSALKREYPGIKLMPFLLDGVAGDANLNQADGIHPTAAGQQIIANRLYEFLKPMVDDVVSRSSGGQ